MTTISVSIPFYNVCSAGQNSKRWARQSVKSVLDQSFEDLELILIDDGSDDDTYEFLDEFTDDPRVTRYTQENQGYPGARNTGLELAKGDYIGFIGQDDLWELPKLERQVDYLIDSEMDLVHSNVLHIDGMGNSLGKRWTEPPPGQNDIEKFITELFFRNFVCIQSVLARAEVFDHYRFDESLLIACDHDMWLKIAGEFNFGYIGETLVRKRYHGGNTSSQFQEVFKERLEVVEKAIERYPFLEEHRHEKLSNVHLTYALGLLSNRDARQGRLAARKAMEYNITNWRAFLAYLISLGGSRFSGSVIPFISKAGSIE